VWLLNCVFEAKSVHTIAFLLQKTPDLLQNDEPAGILSGSSRRPEVHKAFAIHFLQPHRPPTSARIMRMVGISLTFFELSRRWGNMDEVFP
jgi:hypothetical protein